MEHGETSSFVRQSVLPLFIRTADLITLPTCRFRALTAGAYQVICERARTKGALTSIQRTRAIP
jgi:hypothetical protein